MVSIIARYGYRFGAVVFGLFLVAAVSCNDPTEVSVNVPLDTVFHFDTTIVHDTTIVNVHDTTIVFDTTIVHDTTFVPVPVTDTLFIYCWVTDDNKGHPDPPEFSCDNGYMGPRI